MVEDIDICWPVTTSASDSQAEAVPLMSHHLHFLCACVCCPDFFRGVEVKKVRLAGLDHVITFTVDDTGVISLRVYRSEFTQPIFCGNCLKYRVT